MGHARVARAAYPARVEPVFDEPELVRRAQGGDRTAVDALLSHHLPGLEAYVRLRIGRGFGAREGVSDVVQSAHEAARLLRVADGRVPAAQGAATLATLATGLLDVAARAAPEPAAHQSGAKPAAADPPRSWWQRLFGTRR